MIGSLVSLAAGLAWMIFCARAIVVAHRDGQVRGRVSVIRHADRPTAFALNIAFIWVALALGAGLAIFGAANLFA